MNTSGYRSPPEEAPQLDNEHILRHRPKVQVQPLKEEKLEIGGGDTVLVVDDDLMFLEIVIFMLRRLGFTVLEAKDGVEAVEVFKQHPESIRCVLCDMIIPRMNGWETLDALRRPVPGIPVILSSGSAQAEVFAGDDPELPQVLSG
ncbi:response regulator [Desulfopila sp. IMCC35006]|uniref:response regulator n=1 Tax=Desulfopila sp. IMCC35006 TaxID=2569542 RepID=UPI0010ABD8E9|nr:response regulator [Desulfopila sp. IMCC35006]TKB28431.1 response regulator [Desulfopila sp. IMCC35006]